MPLLTLYRGNAAHSAIVVTGSSTRFRRQQMAASAHGVQACSGTHRELPCFSTGAG
jgi:hypothetical protein